MPTNKKPQATDLSTLLTGLNEAGVEFIVVGGLAAVIQGAPITTFDMYIVHRRTDKNIKKLMEFLKSVDAIYRRPDEKIVYPDETDLKGTGYLLLTTDHGPLDVLAVIEKGQGFDELIESALEIEYKGYNTFVLGLEKIVELKDESEDPEERYRLQVYKETLRLKKDSENNEGGME